MGTATGEWYVTEPPAKRRALITGITGQIGSYLAEYLLSAPAGQQYEVHGVLRRTSTPSTTRIDHIRDSLQLHYADLTDPASLYRVLARVQPDEIYNLAAQSHVKVSFETPASTADATGQGFLNLLEAAQQICPGARVYQASSSEQFGNVHLSLFPITEHHPFRPASPYAAAKTFAHNLARVYRESFGMFVACGIVFNTESPRRGINFVTRKITQGVARIATGRDRTPIKLGNLDATRDWMHARDTVRGIHAILQQKEAEDFVLATGVETSVREFLKMAFYWMGIPIEFRGKGKHEHAVVTADADLPHVACEKSQIVAVIDEYYYRPNDVQRLRGDSSKAREKLGWSPEISLEELIQKMVLEDHCAIDPRMRKLNLERLEK